MPVGFRKLIIAGRHREGGPRDCGFDVLPDLLNDGRRDSRRCRPRSRVACRPRSRTRACRSFRRSARSEPPPDPVELDEELELALDGTTKTPGRAVRTNSDSAVAGICTCRSCTTNRRNSRSVSHGMPGLLQLVQQLTTSGPSSDPQTSLGILPARAGRGRLAEASSTIRVGAPPAPGSRRRRRSSRERKLGPARLRRRRASCIAVRAGAGLRAIGEAIRSPATCAHFAPDAQSPSVTHAARAPVEVDPPVTLDVVVTAPPPPPAPLVEALSAP